MADLADAGGLIRAGSNANLFDRAFRAFGYVELWLASSLVILQFPALEATAHVHLLVFAQLVRMIAAVVLFHEWRLWQIVRRPSGAVGALSREAELAIANRPTVHQIVQTVLCRLAVQFVHLLASAVVGLALTGGLIRVVVELAATLRLLCLPVQVALLVLRAVHVGASVDLLAALRLVVPVLALLADAQNAIVDRRTTFGLPLSTVQIAGQRFAGVIRHDQSVLFDVLLGQIRFAHIVKFAVDLSVGVFCG